MPRRGPKSAWSEWIETRLLEMQLRYRLKKGAAPMLSEKIGVTRQTISGWVNGRTPPSQENARALARLFGDATILSLLGYSSNETVIVRLSEIWKDLKDDDRLMILNIVNRYVELGENDDTASSPPSDPTPQSA